MIAKDYLKSKDKLTFVQKIYPKEKIVEIVVEKVAKYAKFENEGVVRLLASADEAHKADQLALTVEEINAIHEETDEILIQVFDKITNYLNRNKSYNEKHLSNWAENVRNEFLTLSSEDKKQFILDAFSISSAGTTNAKGIVKGKIGKASGQQQHKSTIDKITNGSTLIHQSITGLYETRIKL